MITGRLLFWGTPEPAVPFLEYLLSQDRWQVAGVVTQTDKPALRGQNLRSSPVKILAASKNLPVLQPSSLKSPEFLSAIADLKPDAGIVVAYGRIIPKEAIALFPKGLYNIHFSLLPELRGAAPIQWAIFHGHSKTGVTSFRISETLDTGNILSQKETGISSDDTAVDLERKLIPLGIETLKETLSAAEAGQIQGRPQAGTSSSAPLIKKQDARIDWSRSAEEISRQIRAFIRIGPFCLLPNGRTLKILRAAPHPVSSVEKTAPGTVLGVEKNRGFLIQCGKGVLIAVQVQPEGKKEMDAWSFLQGKSLRPGDRLS